MVCILCPIAMGFTIQTCLENDCINFLLSLIALKYLSGSNSIFDAVNFYL